MRLRPAYAYVIGYGAYSVAAGYYLFALPLFLFLSGIIQAIPLIALFEAFADFITSALADFRQLLGRRIVFLTGFTLQAAGLFSWIIYCAHLYQVVSPFNFLLGTELLRRAGDACISGTFDSWAISLEQASDASFAKAEMFTQMRALNRSGVLVGSVLAGLVFLASSRTWSPASLSFPTQTAGDLDSWIYVWIVAALLQSVATLFIATVTRDHKQTLEQVVLSSTRRRLSIHGNEGFRSFFADAYRVAFSREGLPSIALMSVWYATAFTLTFSWPKLGSDLGVVGLMVFPAICAFGQIGASYATKLARANRGREVELGTRYLRLSGWAMLYVGIGILGYSASTQNGDHGHERIIGSLLVLLVCSIRIPQYICEPFLLAVVHDNVQHEDLRSAIVSLRSIASSVVAALFSAFTASLVKTAPSSPLGHAALLLMSGILIHVSLSFVSRKRKIEA